ncbi:hypothetical protein BD410DRAFT_846659 [Rickenella mellea]|uniref:Uncharacterized protein n=1 Tax=Rickenella mellea TaxID=50990 RepID=A0A4Y7PGS8_9AGAM|nr:hypothetical protein BD410DRAFT_846659 [Rickenella mellea]
MHRKQNTKKGESFNQAAIRGYEKKSLVILPFALVLVLIGTEFFIEASCSSGVELPRQCTPIADPGRLDTDRDIALGPVDMLPTLALGRDGGAGGGPILPSTKRALLTVAEDVRPRVDGVSGRLMDSDPASERDEGGRIGTGLNMPDSRRLPVRDGAVGVPPPVHCSLQLNVSSGNAM